MMSNGNESRAALLRQFRTKIANYRGEQNEKLDGIMGWIDDNELLEVKEIKVVPQEASESGTKPAAPPAPAEDPGAATVASTPAVPVNSGKTERV
jgi:hypothetical protein